MDTVTVEQVKKVIYDNNIRTYQVPTVCTECGRGTRYYFYRSDKFTLDNLYRQRGCDCDWVPSEEMSYDDFVTMLNSLSPDDRKVTWDAFIASGNTKSDKVKNTLPDVTREKPSEPVAPVELTPISKIIEKINEEFQSQPPSS